MCPQEKRRFFDFRFVGEERRKALILGCILLWSVLSFFFISRYIIGMTVIRGNSMHPTLIHTQRRLIHRWAYLWEEPRRGDVVAYQDPYDGTLSVKRIIALPGERIQLRKGYVYVNGMKLAEPYLTPDAWTYTHKLGDHEYEVDAGHYFVLGDNRKTSEDSRDIGAIARESILGKIHAP